MNELKTFKIRFNNNGVLCESVVMEETFDKAENLLINDYKEYGINIIIEEYEEITEKGVILTWHQPL